MIPQVLNEIVVRAEALRSEQGRIVIAIDGRGGAGKSSLARSLVAALPRSAHVEHDWFHLPKAQVSPGRRFDHERLIREVLSPFRSGEREVSFLRYNWGYLAGKPDGYHDTATTIGGADVLILEGCDTLNPTLAPHLDLRIWLNTPPEVALERGMRRDIEEYGLDPDRVRAAWTEWSGWEEESLARDDRRTRADIVV
jgi:uridine kinase